MPKGHLSRPNTHSDRNTHSCPETCFRLHLIGSPSKGFGVILELIGRGRYNVRLGDGEELALKIGALTLKE